MNNNLFRQIKSIKFNDKKKNNKYLANINVSTSLQKVEKKNKNKCLQNNKNENKKRINKFLVILCTSVNIIFFQISSCIH